MPCSFLTPSPSFPSTRFHSPPTDWSPHRDGHALSNGSRDPRPHERRSPGSDGPEHFDGDKVDDNGNSGNAAATAPDLLFSLSSPAPTTTTTRPRPRQGLPRLQALPPSLQARRSLLRRSLLVPPLPQRAHGRGRVGPLEAPRARALGRPRGRLRPLRHQAARRGLLQHVRRRVRGIRLPAVLLLRRRRQGPVALRRLRHLPRRGRAPLLPLRDLLVLLLDQPQGKPRLRREQHAVCLPGLLGISF